MIENETRKLGLFAMKCLFSKDLTLLFRIK